MNDRSQNPHSGSKQKLPGEIHRVQQLMRIRGDKSLRDVIVKAEEALLSEDHMKMLVAWGKLKEIV
jgi:hypothetical protein